MASIITKGSVINNAKCMVAKNALDGWVFPLNQKIPKTSNKDEWYVWKFPGK